MGFCSESMWGMEAWNPLVAPRYSKNNMPVSSSLYCLSVSPSSKPMVPTLLLIPCMPSCEPAGLP